MSSNAKPYHLYFLKATALHENASEQECGHTYWPNGSVTIDCMIRDIHDDRVHYLCLCTRDSVLSELICRQMKGWRISLPTSEDHQTKDYVLSLLTRKDQKERFYASLEASRARNARTSLVKSRDATAASASVGRCNEWVMGSIAPAILFGFGVLLLHHLIIVCLPSVL
ncbi:hypothetical protein DFH11DRAFT_427664 [Phellopilus nigrolimitatus]|nr:hypothetical protein DFH11DRAFT_427664 [Phellopilus nigrolimitatus]